MITKGFIESIATSANTCSVRVPLFESPNDTIPALLDNVTFAVQPGTYNSYKSGDAVFVGFENNSLSKPIILGKLYTSAEAANTLGGIACDTLKLSSLSTKGFDNTDVAAVIKALSDKIAALEAKLK